MTLHILTPFCVLLSILSSFKPCLLDITYFDPLKKELFKVYLSKWQDTFSLGWTIYEWLFCMDQPEEMILFHSLMKKMTSLEKKSSLVDVWLRHTPTRDDFVSRDRDSRKNSSLVDVWLCHTSTRERILSLVTVIFFINSWNNIISPGWSMQKSNIVTHWALLI